MSEQIDEDQLCLSPEVKSSLAEKSFAGNEEYRDRLYHVLTRPPMFTTVRVDLMKTDMTEALTAFRQTLNSQCEEKGFPPFEVYQHPTLKDCIIVKNRGPQPLLKLNKYVIVDLACGMAVLRGAHVFKQGIMGAPTGLKTGDLVSVYSDFSGKCLKGFSGDYNGRKLFVGNGISQVTRADLFNKDDPQSGLGIQMKHPLYQAPSLSDLGSGVLFPQNLPSIVCGHAVDPRPGEVILDMCAAPGGKTTHLASLMKGEGKVVALEKSGGRVTKMKAALGRMHCTNVEVHTYDATKAVSQDADTNGPPPYPPASFDRILVDAPCSALGQRPCFVNKLHINQLRSYPVLQHKLLTVAVELLRPGGTLVYSTCTITVEENEEQVAWILAKYPSMELVPVLDQPLDLSIKGLANSGLSEEQRSKVYRFDPCQTLLKPPSEDLKLCNIDTIGFFIAKFIKIPPLTS